MKGDRMSQFLTQHEFWSIVVLYWIYSAAVSSMPDPAANRNPGYAWLYRFLHTIAGNLTTAFSGKIPGLKALVFILIVQAGTSRATRILGRSTMIDRFMSPADRHESPLKNVF